VPHAEIVEHVSSILNSNGVVHFGKGIDTGNLEWFDVYWLHLYSLQFLCTSDVYIEISFSETLLVLKLSALWANVEY